jgi:purine-binding chemotaxis protein CheW
MNGTPDEPDVTESYVVFQLGEEGYAVEVSRVREVVDAGVLSAVPGAPRALAGLYNLRGQIVPVWDLRVPFGLSDPPHSGRAPGVLVVEPDPAHPARVAGLRVDRVSDVLEVALEDLQDIPAIGLGPGSAFVRGLVRHKDRFLLVLDLDRIFASLVPSDSRR